MAAPECGVFGCGKQAAYKVMCPATERRHENWYACLDHVPRILRFICDREAKLNVPMHQHGAQELSQV
jgi:hypothetical protein